MPCAAQESDDPFDTARFRFGPLRLTPVVELTNLGTDSNVFNESDDPKSDTTAAFGPLVRFWMRPGAVRISGRTGAQYLYFREYDSQRAWNMQHELRAEWMLGRLTPFVGGEYLNTKDRLGYEIDSRSRRRDISATAGLGVRLGARSQVVGSYRRFKAEYDEDETFLGATLARELNHEEERAELQYRHALTPLTTLVIRNEYGKDRFETSQLRNSESFRIMPGFEFKPAALVAGSVFVGYRHFDAAVPIMSDYSGVVAEVAASYAHNGTRFEVGANRDLAYSYSIERPYYALLDTRLVVTHRLAAPFELVGRLGRQNLAYRMANGDDASAPTDRGYVYGAGAGYLPGEMLRLGFDVIYSTRRSEVAGRRDYEGLRVFGSVTYGIRQ